VYIYMYGIHVYVYIYMYRLSEREKSSLTFYVLNVSVQKNVIVCTMVPHCFVVSFVSRVSVLSFTPLLLAKKSTRVPVELARDGIHREQIFFSVSLCSWCTSSAPACTTLETEILEQSQNTRSFTLSSVLPSPYQLAM